MTPISVSDKETREHLWDSFASLIRSYATIETMPGGKPTVENNGEEIEVRVGKSKMQMLLNQHDGTGQLVIRPEGEFNAVRPFSLELDGTIQIDGVGETLDLTAIRWLRQFSKALKAAEERTTALLALVATL